MFVNLEDPRFAPYLSLSLLEEIKKTWDEEEKGPEIIETPSEVKGLNDMEIGKFN